MTRTRFVRAWQWVGLVLLLPAVVAACSAAATLQREAQVADRVGFVRGHAAVARFRVVEVEPGSPGTPAAAWVAIARDRQAFVDLSRSRQAAQHVGDVVVGRLDDRDNPGTGVVVPEDVVHRSRIPIIAPGCLGLGAAALLLGLGAVMVARGRPLARPAVEVRAARMARPV